MSHFQILFVSTIPLLQSLLINKVLWLFSQQMIIVLAISSTVISQHVDKCAIPVKSWLESMWAVFYESKFMKGMRSIWELDQKS